MVAPFSPQLATLNNDNQKAVIVEVSQGSAAYY